MDWLQGTSMVETLFVCLFACLLVCLFVYFLRHFVGNCLVKFLKSSPRIYVYSLVFFGSLTVCSGKNAFYYDLPTCIKHGDFP